MIRISQIKVPVKHTKNDLYAAIFKKLQVSHADFLEFKIIKRSLDARDKNDIHYVYTVDVTVLNENSLLIKNRRNPYVAVPQSTEYSLPEAGDKKIGCRPVVTGSGPAGLFCAYFLAKYGFRPILIERGCDVDKRIKIVSDFWEGKSGLNAKCNVLFGEGGAGTFSDGKLSTGIKDSLGRKTLVLDTFVKFGAKPEILYESKPHIGTDKLVEIVKNIRLKIIESGGKILFNTTLSGLNISDGGLNGIIVSDSGNTYKLKEINSSVLILAIGHSARDTFKMLYDNNIKMEPKAFAVGIRAEHLQKLINEAQYGKNYKKRYGGLLPPADYKLTYRSKDNRSVYTFCMCPGGYVVNSSSEDNRLCVNGMSYFARDGLNSNSAIIVSVNPDDFDDKGPLGGVEFQRKLEENAFLYGKGAIPVQKLGDFVSGDQSNDFGEVTPCIKGEYAFADINKILPDFVCRDIKEAFAAFGEKIDGFNSDDTLLYAVESRTSSPLRIIRDAWFESNVKGIFPCGEGAGYAGGIMSAAIDGIRIFEEIYRRYHV